MHKENVIDFGTFFLVREECSHFWSELINRKPAILNCKFSSLGSIRLIAEKCRAWRLGFDFDQLLQFSFY